MKLAIIDLGTNSVRFDIYQCGKPPKIKRLFRQKQMIRLGDGSFERGELRREAISRTLKAFERFQKRINHVGVDRVVAFATSALRDSKNASRVVCEIYRRTHIPLQIISGQREARLIARGVLKRTQAPSGLFGLIDIGGGSCELSLCYGSSIIKSYSFGLGANRLQQIFLKSHPPRSTPETENPMKELRKHIRKTIHRSIPEMDCPVLKVMVGSSGTIRGLRRLIHRGEAMRVQDLSKQIRKMSKLSLSELKRLPGMPMKRADIILAGAILLEEMLHFFETKIVYTTDYGLREGMLDFALSEHY